MIVVLYPIKLGECLYIYISKKRLKLSTFSTSFSDRKSGTKEARIHESKANSTIFEVLPDRNCFGKAKFLANNILPTAVFNDNIYNRHGCTGDLRL